jgi:flagellin
MANSYATGDAAQYSMQLLRGQMINQLMLGQIGGMSLNEFILGKPTMRSGREMMNDALTGLMRSDAAMLHQASKNMGEGESISKIAGEAVKSIRDKIIRMQDISDALFNSSTPLADHSTLKAEYSDLASQIKATIENTSYNGMKLLDGSAWTDGRITSIGTGETGKLTLQAGQSPTDLTLYNLAIDKNFFDNTPADNNAFFEGTYAFLETKQQTLSGMQQSYEARAGLYAAEASSYERQADIIDEATGKATPGDVQSLKDSLLNILLREQGLVVNSNS